MGIVANYNIDDPSVLKRFNWGAFGLTFLWGLGNGAFGKTWWIIIVGLLFTISVFAAFFGGFIFPIIMGIVNLGVAIYFGIKGNEWAADGRAFYDNEDFVRTQKNWAIAFFSIVGVSIVSVVLVIIMWAAILALIMGVANSGAHSSTIPAGGLSNNTSQDAKIIVADIIAGEKASGKFTSGPAAVDYLIENSSFVKSKSFMLDTTKYSSNAFQMALKDSPDNIFYLFLVKKEENCDLALKNCYVTRYQMHRKGERPHVAEKVYFDSKGKIKAAKLSSK